MLGRIESGPFQERDDAIINNNEPQEWALTIEEEGWLSDEVELGPYVLCGILMPGAWTAANLTFQARSHSQPARDVYDSAGDEVVVTAAAARYIIVDPADFAGCRYLAVRSGTTGTPVVQNAERAIVLIVRPV